MLVKCHGKLCTMKQIEELLEKYMKERPQDFDPIDCCGSGCEKCTRDAYDRKMAAFEEQ